MIDIENQVFTPIAKALRKQFPGVTVSSSYVHAPKCFPHVSLVEQDNYLSVEHLDTNEAERFATLMYEVNVYSDKASGKKTECRSIMKVIDDMMYQRNFRRISISPITNMENATIYRLVARYVAITDGTTMYRR